VPLLSRWFIRTGLLYLLVALTTSLVQALIPSGTTIAWPTYLHLLVVGWLTQLIFGVAYWMFPRYQSGLGLRFERLGWICYGCLNLGLLLRVATESGPESSWQAESFVVSALLQLIAGWAFVVTTWPRVRGR
jgi:hypothetical protein